jgi:cytochrome c oxidase assembly protein Cox11
MTLFSREFFDTLIIVVVIIGLAFAAVRLYRDFTRPLPPEDDTRR